MGCEEQREPPIVDGLLSYLVAFVTVLASQKNQRLGDMAAHTLVVRK